MEICISLVSGKGGAGKTTAVILVAGEYALHGKQVLWSMPMADKT